MDSEGLFYWRKKRNPTTTTKKNLQEGESLKNKGESEISKKLGMGGGSLFLNLSSSSL